MWTASLRPTQFETTTLMFALELRDRSRSGRPSRLTALLGALRDR